LTQRPAGAGTLTTIRGTGASGSETIEILTCHGIQVVSGNQCVCPQGLRSTGKSCEVCPEGSHAQGELCLLCMNGTVWDGGQCVCPSGTAWIGGSCVTPICPPGTHWNGWTCMCPPGATWNGSQCVGGAPPPSVAGGNVTRGSINCSWSGYGFNDRAVVQCISRPAGDCQWPDADGTNPTATNAFLACFRSSTLATDAEALRACCANAGGCYRTPEQYAAAPGQFCQ
jgi:hypothetical protein